VIGVHTSVGVSMDIWAQRGVGSSTSHNILFSLSTKCTIKPNHSTPYRLTHTCMIRKDFPQ